MSDELGFGQFDILAPLLVQLGRLANAGLDHDVVWVFPPEVLPGVTKAYGIPVVRGWQLPEPYLAHSAPPRREPLPPPIDGVPQPRRPNPGIDERGRRQS